MIPNNIFEIRLASLYIIQIHLFFLIWIKMIPTVPPSCSVPVFSSDLETNIDFKYELLLVFCTVDTSTSMLTFCLHQILSFLVLCQKSSLFSALWFSFGESMRIVTDRCGIGCGAVPVGCCISRCCWLFEFL